LALIRGDGKWREYWFLKAEHRECRPLPPAQSSMYNQSTGGIEWTLGSPQSSFPEVLLTPLKYIKDNLLWQYFKRERILWHAARAEKNKWSSV